MSSYSLCDGETYIGIANCVQRIELTMSSYPLCDEEKYIGIANCVQRIELC